MIVHSLTSSNIADERTVGMHGGFVSTNTLLPSILRENENLKIVHETATNINVFVVEGNI